MLPNITMKHSLAVSMNTLLQILFFQEYSRTTLGCHIPVSSSQCALGCDSFCLSSFVLIFLKISETSPHVCMAFFWQLLFTSCFLWWCLVLLKHMAALYTRPRWSISSDGYLMTWVSQCLTGFITEFPVVPLYTLSSERDSLKAEREQFSSIPSLQENLQRVLGTL